MPTVQQNEPFRDYSRIFKTFGVEFSVNGSPSNLLADACPWCGKDKFYLNPDTGQFDCKKCQQKGNMTTYLTWLHGEYLRETGRDHYLALKDKRGIASQTLKKHELAYDEAGSRWLIPFKSSKGTVVNLQLYYPDRPKPNKVNLPGLPTAIYGFHNLSEDKKKPVFLCEGPFDAIALDYAIGANNSQKYTIVATPGGFKEEWAQHFKGRKVRALYDNDKAGQEHTNRVQTFLCDIAADMQVLEWPADCREGYDINDLVKEHHNVGGPEITYGRYQGLGIVGWLEKHSVSAAATSKLDYEHGWEENPEDAKPIEWIWPDHLRCGTWVSFSGQQGTLKSTIARELVARYTTGRKMPMCKRVGLPAGHAIYITAEDDKKEVKESLLFAGADKNLFTIIRAITKGGDPLNVLENLKELRSLIRKYRVRLVVIDGQNSVVGAPPIDTDMKARHNVTNKLHQFAQQEDICLIGIRNEDPTGRAMGPQSMCDIGRCVLRVEELKSKGSGRYFKLVFKKVSDCSPKLYPPILYSVEDCGGNLRRILWGKESPPDKQAKKLFQALRPK
jgi:hypothetical protein